MRYLGKGDGAARALALAGALLLSACGFAPAHAPGGAGAALQGAVAVTAPDSADGYRLLTAIEDRLGRADAGRWHLVTHFEVAESAAAVSADGIIRRNTLTGTVDWRLTETATGRQIASDRATAFVGYGTGGNTVAIRAAEADARARLAAQLADLVVTRLIALRGL